VVQTRCTFTRGARRHQTWLVKLRESAQDLETGVPAPEDAIAAAESIVGPVAPEQRELYSIANGLSCRSFRLFPVFVESAARKTWDSIQRANNPTDAFSGDVSLLKRFLVFADIGNGFAMIDRTDGSLWFEEANSDDLRQTDLDFRGLVDLLVRQAG
jgi:hypothetical protein